jgi:hypothetical protein
MLAKFLPILRPRVKMRLDINSASNTLLLPHTPKLLERTCAVDTRLIRPRRLQNIICGTVGCDRSVLLGCTARVVTAVRLDDVVFDPGVAGPAVEGDVGVYVGRVPGAAVGYVADAAGVLVLLEEVGKGVGGKSTQPLPATKLPTLDHWTLYCGRVSIIDRMLMGSDLRFRQRRCCRLLIPDHRSRRSKRSRCWYQCLTESTWCSRRRIHPVSGPPCRG